MKNITSTNSLHSCTGCGMCSAVCPTNAITINLSTDGFYIPSVDFRKCVECGKCIKTCYKYDLNYKCESKGEDNLVCLSAKNHNKKELCSSSSGAVSIELMRCCIEEGYKVVGVAYDNVQERAVTKIAGTKEELEQFKGSKYFQSYTEDAFRTVAQDTSKQKYAIFGTPCQIYAFSKYAELTNNLDRFLLVDIFCHGCPSFTLWTKYLEEKKKEYKVSGFSDVKFRSKTHGWHEFCFDFVNAEKMNTSSKYDDPFYEMFFSNDILNNACYDCVARGSVEKADIRLGDFWGARYDLDTEGVSAVVLCSEKGIEFFDKIKSQFECQTVAFDEIIEEQSYGTEYGISQERRNKALQVLNSDIAFSDIVREHKKLISTSQKAKNYLKKILKHLPQKYYTKIKYTFHNRK